MNLNEEGKNVSDNAELCCIFSNYFSEDISSLKIASLINNSAVGLIAVSNPLSIATNAQKMKFAIMDFFCKCDQIRSFLRI